MRFFRLFKSEPTISEKATLSSDLAHYYSHIHRAQQTECPNLRDLCEAIGIDADSMPLRPHLCGWIASCGNTWRIIYNRDHSLPRQRFTIAHMIGHHFLHRDLMSEPNVEGANDSMEFQQIQDAPCYNPAILPKHEIQANRFAIGLLMPSPILQRLVDEGLSVPEIAKRLSTSVDATRIRLKNFVPTAKNQECSPG